MSEHEIDAYDLVPDWVARRAKLVRIPWLPGPYRGMTIGTLILMRGDLLDRGINRVVAHELVHVRQYMEYGKLGFWFRYLKDFFTLYIGAWDWDNAYRSIGFEAEAYALDREWVRRRTNPRHHGPDGGPVPESDPPPTDQR